MDKLLNLINESALKVVMIDAQDLPALAGLHEQFEQIEKQVEQIDTASVDQLQILKQASAAAGDLVEKIILQDISDSNSTLKTITETAQSMQMLAQQIAQGASDQTVQFPQELNLSTAQSTFDNQTLDTSINFELPEYVDEEILREFINTQPHVLANLEAAILAAEKDASEENRSAVKGILHSIKGETGLMGLEKLAALCHEAESLLEDAQAPFPGNKLLATKDLLGQAIAQFSGASPTVSVTEQNQENQTKPQQGSSPVEPAEDAITIAEGDVPLVVDFVNESSEHLDSAEADLLTIEENPEDPDIINAIFRAFHTIKGVAGFLNLTQIGSLAHATENLLDLARKGNLTLAGASIDVVFEALDVMKKMLAS